MIDSNALYDYLRNLIQTCANEVVAQSDSISRDGQTLRQFLTSEKVKAEGIYPSEILRIPEVQVILRRYPEIILNNMQRTAAMAILNTANGYDGDGRKIQ